MNALTLHDPAFVGSLAGGLEPVALSEFWAYYDADETPPSNLLDITGNGHDMTASSTPGSDTGIIGDCRTTDDTKGFSVDVTSLSYFGASSDWTVAFWFKTDIDALESAELMTISGTTGSPVDPLVMTIGGGNTLSIGTTSLGGVGVATNVTHDAWRHIAFGMDTSKTNKAWIQIGTGARQYFASSLVAQAGTVSLYICTHAPFTRTVYIDNGGLVDGVLTPGQIRWLAKGNVPS